LAKLKPGSALGMNISQRIPGQAKEVASLKLQAASLTPELG